MMFARTHSVVAVAPKSGLRTLIFALIATGLLSAVLPAPRCALADAVAAPTKPATAEELLAKRTKLAAQIAKIEQSQKAAEEGEKTGAADDSGDELDLLQSLDSTYAQQQSDAEQRAELEAEKKRLTEEIDAFQKFGPAEAKPYSFLLLENIRDQLAAEVDRAATYTAELETAGQMLDAARESFEGCERERRQARESLEESTDSEQKISLARELELAELNSQTAQETVQLRRAQIETKQLRQELAKSRRAYFADKSERIAKDVHFTEHDHRARVAQLTRVRGEFQRKLKSAQKQQRDHETQQPQALAKLEKDQAEKSVVTAAAEAYRVARRVHFEEIALINQRLEEVEHLKHFVNCRFEMASGKATHDELKDWREQLVEAVDRLKATEQSLDLRLEEIRADQATIYGRQQDADAENQAVAPWITLQSSQLSRLAELCETSLPQLRSGRRLLERFRDDLAAATHQEAGVDHWAKFRDAVQTFWNYELASVNDRPITIGKIVSGLLYVLAGVVLARLISGLVGRQLLPRFGLNQGAINAIQSISFYSLCVIFSLLALELVNLPFAAFTFLGGAVAIGVGFGSQNIMNNFISGLILLAEQPIRVGDRVQIDGVAGTVEQIGARSTRVRTMANYEIIVPNSQLLENKVTNLTLSDDLVQTAIGISMSPTLPVDEVIRRLRDAAMSHPKVLTEPEPVVLFLSFSETVLSFELHFRQRLNNLMDSRVVESEIRAAISEALHNTDAATTRLMTAVPVSPDEKPVSVLSALAESNVRDAVGRRKAG